MPLIKGAVVDEEGSPVSRALIAVESGTAPYPDIAIYSDEQGSFSIHLPSGHFQLGFYSSGGSHRTVECNSDANEFLLVHLSNS